jgi:hypothetical protein
LGCPAQSWRWLYGNQGSAKEEARSYRGGPAEAFGSDEGSLGRSQKSRWEKVRL